MITAEFREALERLKRSLFLERVVAAGGTPSDQTIGFAPRAENSIVGFGYRQRGDLLTVEVLTKDEVDPETVERYLVRCGLEGIPYEIVVTGRIITTGRPALGGDSISQTSLETGTLGCIVKDRSGERMGLSCCHILNPSNSAQIGRAEIWHPGAVHGGCSSDRIGLLAGYWPLQFDDGSENLVDAAVFRPDDPAWVSNEIREIGPLRGVQNGAPFDSKVRKFGAQSNLTAGRLHLKGVALKVVFSNGFEAIFDNQFAFIGLEEDSQFCVQGDSGSVLVDEDNMAVGMLFATTAGVDLTFATPLQNVLESLKVALA